MVWKILKHKTCDVLQQMGKMYNLDIMYFLSGGVWLSFGFFANTLLGLLLAVAFTRLTGKAFYGQYQFILVIVTVMTFFSLPGLSNAVSQSVASGYDSSLIRATKFRVRFSFLGSIALLVTAAWFFYVHPESFYGTFIIAALFFPLLAYDTYTDFLVGKKRFDLISKYTTISRFFIILLVIFAIVFTKNMLVIITTYLLSTAITNLYFYYKVRKFVRATKEDKALLHYGFHLSLIEIVTIIATQVDKLLLSYYLGFEGLAIYAIASAFPEQLKGLIRISINLLLPKFSEFKGDIYYHAKHKILFSFVISFAAAAIGFIVVPFVIPLFFGASYAQSSFYAQLLFTQIIFVLPGFIFYTMLQAKKKIKQIYRFNIAYSILTIVSLFILVPKYGMLGAITVRVGLTAFNTFYLWWLAIR